MKLIAAFGKVIVGVVAFFGLTYWLTDLKMYTLDRYGKTDSTKYDRSNGEDKENRE